MLYAGTQIPLIKPLDLDLSVSNPVEYPTWEFSPKQLMCTDGFCLYTEYAKYVHYLLCSLYALFVICFLRHLLRSLFAFFAIRFVSLVHYSKWN